MKKSKQKLWRCEAPLIDGSVYEVVERALNECAVLPLLKRPVGRRFCTPGQNLGTHPEDVYPFGRGDFGIDEIWFGCCIPAVTGNIDHDTGKPIFREGEAHVISFDEGVYRLQDAIEEDPRFMIGEQTEARTRVMFGCPTLPIYDKYFDNGEPLPHHIHIKKHEGYHHDPLMNTRVRPWDRHYTAMGFMPGVTKDQVFKALKAMKGPHYNGIRDLAFGVPMPLDGGFLMPAGTWHAPTDLCTQEPQVRLDEHVLGDNVTEAGFISEEAALFANNMAPKGKKNSWEWVLEQTRDWNWDPDFAKKHRCMPVLDKKMSDDQAEFWWVIHGLIHGNQEFSTIKVIVKPGCSTRVHAPSWSINHLIMGRGSVGGLEVESVKNWRIGQITYDSWFTPFGNAISSDGILVENTGTENLVFKMTFGPDAWRKLPK
jgi:hypothetical protein